MKAFDMSTNGRILRHCAETRGYIINGVTQLERLVDVVLSYYFSDNEKKRDELVDLVFSQPQGMVSFEIKRGILMLILKKYGKTEYEKEYSKFLKDVKNAIDERNIFAHYLLDRTPEGLKLYAENKIFMMIKFKEEDPIKYTEERVLEICNNIENCISKTIGIIDRFK